LNHSLLIQCRLSQHLRLVFSFLAPLHLQFSASTVEKTKLFLRMVPGERRETRRLARLSWRQRSHGRRLRLRPLEDEGHGEWRTGLEGERGLGFGGVGAALCLTHAVNASRPIKLDGCLPLNPTTTRPSPTEVFHNPFSCYTSIPII